MTEDGITCTIYLDKEVGEDHNTAIPRLTGSLSRQEEGSEFSGRLEQVNLANYKHTEEELIGNAARN